MQTLSNLIQYLLINLELSHLTIIITETKISMMKITISN